MSVKEIIKKLTEKIIAYKVKSAIIIATGLAVLSAAGVAAYMGFSDSDETTKTSDSIAEKTAVTTTATTNTTTVATSATTITTVCETTILTTTADKEQQQIDMLVEQAKNSPLKKNVFERNNIYILDLNSDENYELLIRYDSTIEASSVDLLYNYELYTVENDTVVHKHDFGSSYPLYVGIWDNENEHKLVMIRNRMGMGATELLFDGTLGKDIVMMIDNYDGVSYTIDDKPVSMEEWDSYSNKVLSNVFGDINDLFSNQLKIIYNDGTSETMEIDPDEQVNSLKGSIAIVNVSDSLNLRKECSTDSEVVMKLPPKAELIISDECYDADFNQWYEVKYYEYLNDEKTQYKEHRGYVSGEYVEIKRKTAEELQKEQQIERVTSAIYRTVGYEHDAPYFDKIENWPDISIADFAANYVEDEHIEDDTISIDFEDVKESAKKYLNPGIELSEDEMKYINILFDNGLLSSIREYNPEDSTFKIITGYGNGGEVFVIEVTDVVSKDGYIYVTAVPYYDGTGGTSECKTALSGEYILKFDFESRVYTKETKLEDVVLKYYFVFSEGENGDLYIEAKSAHPIKSFSPETGVVTENGMPAFPTAEVTENCTSVGNQKYNKGSVVRLYSYDIVETADGKYLRIITEDGRVDKMSADYLKINE